MFKKFSLLVVYLSIAIFSAKSQNRNQVLYLINNDWKVINPAFASFNRLHDISTFGYKYMDIEGAPESINAIYSLHLPEIHSTFGVSYASYRIGVHTSNYYKTLYNQHINFNEHRLVIGASINLLSQKSDWSDLELFGQDDPLLTETTHDSNLDMDLALAYQYKNWQLGLSVANLIATKISYGTEFVEESRNPRRLYFHAGYNVRLNKWVELKPTLLYSGQLASQGIGDYVIANLRIDMLNYIIAGVGFENTTNDQLKPYYSAGLKWKDFASLVILMDASQRKAPWKELEMSLNMNFGPKTIN